MHAVLNAADFDVVSDDRGGRAQERFETLGMGDREWERRTGIARSTLLRAFDPEKRTHSTTFDAIEKWLDVFEQENAGVPETDPGDDLVEFHVSGDFGVEVVVKGPVRDRDELADSVARLIQKMRERN